jgi:3-hydroxyisobutyrate dehydrogenase-like beta-hydroxyacid dehydrogenase
MKAVQTLGFIGLGNLGLPIATNLCKAGYAMKVYNRTAAKAKPLADLGATVTASASDACTGGIVITLVADDAALKEIANDAFAKQLGHDGIHLSMSTVGANTSRELASHHKKFGVHYISAPVFARPEAAAAKLGTVCLSGGTEAKRTHVRPILTDAVAKNIFDLGDDAGAAHVIKLIGNFMIASSVELLAEVFALAEKNGIPPQSVHDIFSTTLFASPIFQNYGRIILGKSFEPASFRLTLGLKDINLVLDNGLQSGTPLPIAELLKQRMSKGISNGNADLDWASFSQEARKDAGL